MTLLAKRLLGLLSLAITMMATAQNTSYWQQQANYSMELEMDVENYQYQGTQTIVYTNNSPDELNQVFYHLYFNAFQPGSEMDARLSSIADPDGRMMADKKSRISPLSESEMGYLGVSNLLQDGKPVTFNIEGTVLQALLATPIAPGASTTFTLDFEGQVPLQIRRSGRNSSEGVALSMSQWYPKMAEYDFEGWHADPYIAREFHGVWGDYDVKITIAKDYTLGGTGYLQNPQEIGHGYQAPGSKVKKQKGANLTWHFKAPMVHDFMWAADPEYTHDVLQMENGPTLHFLYKNKESLVENWKALQPKTEAAMNFFSKNIGKYPYEQYSVVQGGDGGMEYAMSTLITGERKLNSLIGVMVHEMAHSWFQHILATNEAKHSWMDEGFTSFISALCMQELSGKTDGNPFAGSYRGYQYLVKSGKEQPQTTHSDRYAENTPYSIAAYSKGAIFLAQLGYVIGQDKLMETIQKYFQDFKFKHPTPNDIKRTAEKVSGMQLDWYLMDWTQTTNTIDYALTNVAAKNLESTAVSLERKGLMPMPIDILVVYKDGTQETFYVPLRMARGGKDNPFPSIPRTVLPSWAWAYPTYDFIIDRPYESIAAVQIDPSGLMADVDLDNNSLQAAQE
ncbi:MAG: M1 family metallopeptidase [Flavobacteriia bacterium]|nr:M1 family metallopeptidase [Flavobacteriia bacterium]